jgi:AmmeMemoRadiSam system protein A
MILVRLARSAIADHLNIEFEANIADDNRLRRKAATFVTLHKYGRLRGCIGTLEAWRSLGEDVRANAIAAAFHDPRFAPLDAAEFEHIQIEVSVLTEPQPMSVEGEQAALSRLRPHRDGVVLKYGSHSATFLPQVWEQLPSPAQFMAQLKCKAGLAADFWHADVQLYTYQVSKQCEPEGS